MCASLLLKSPARRAGRGRDRPEHKQGAGWAASTAKGHFTLSSLVAQAGRASVQGVQAAGAGDKHRAGLRVQRSTAGTAAQRLSPLLTPYHTWLGCRVPVGTEVLGRGTGVWGDSASARMHRHTGTALRGRRGTAASSGMSRTCSSILARDAAAEPGGSGGCPSRVPRPGEPQLQQPGGDGSAGQGQR